mmetsp:Transcript_3578/g.11097  ORF Transcript_3578/g.11097 Transcript_3578/m.11097 type:complete len:203 (-) Transcript_3578:337-945(-)
MFSFFFRRVRTLGLREHIKTTHAYCHAVGSSPHKAPSRFKTTDGEDPQCGSWIKLWEKVNGQSRSVCMFDRCTNAAVLGAHVQKAASDVNSVFWYIIPACKNCNNMHKNKKFEQTAAVKKVGPKGGFLKGHHRAIHVAYLKKGNPSWFFPGSRWRPKPPKETLNELPNEQHSDSDEEEGGEEGEELNPSAELPPEDCEYDEM